METLRVRPVLVESKERTDIWWSGYKMYYNRTPEEPRTSCYQIVLISLEDEKIEVGDKYYSLETKEIDILQENELSMSYDRKVIATQNNLSPELIDQLINEYNNGDMKDFKIEMLEFPVINGYLGEKEFKPKLTNGFITVASKPIYQQIIDDCGGEEAFCELTEITKNQLFIQKKKLKN